MIIQNVVIPDENTQAQAWISYYKELNKKFSKTDTNTIFLKTWEYAENDDLTDNETFVEFFRDKGIDFGSGLYDVKKTVKDIGNTILGVPKTIMFIAVLPFITVLAGVIGFSIYKIVRK